MASKGPSDQCFARALMCAQQFKSDCRISRQRLMLRVDRTVAKRWVLRVTIRGKRRDIGLGSARVVSLQEARERQQSGARMRARAAILSPPNARLAQPFRTSPRPSNSCMSSGALRGEMASTSTSRSTRFGITPFPRSATSSSPRSHRARSGRLITVGSGLSLGDLGHTPSAEPAAFEAAVKHVECVSPPWRATAKRREPRRDPEPVPDRGQSSRGLRAAGLGNVEDRSRPALPINCWRFGDSHSQPHGSSVGLSLS
jgi:hypothetical protein